MNAEVRENLKKARQARVNRFSKDELYQTCTQTEGLDLVKWLVKKLPELVLQDSLEHIQYVLKQASLSKRWDVVAVLALVNPNAMLNRDLLSLVAKAGQIEIVKLLARKADLHKLSEFASLLSDRASPDDEDQPSVKEKKREILELAAKLETLESPLE
jgi:hypothetical protein